MKILLDGYFDHNIGDDLMLTLAARELGEHKLYLPSDKLRIDGVEYTTEKTGFDAYLKVIGSGFYIYNKKGIYYRLREMYREARAARLHGVIGCNITEMKNGAALRIIKSHLKSFDFITVRDTFSRDYIKENIAASKVTYYPDIVFSLSDEMIPDVKAENLLGISVHNLADFSAVAETADRYIAETGGRVSLLCFDTGAENDMAAAERVRELSKSKNRIEIVPYQTIFGMLEMMKRCKCILGARFHSVILSARMGIPFVPLMYSTKMAHVLDDLDYDRERFTAQSFVSEKVIDRILTETPFKLPPGTTQLAKRHAGSFNEYLKQQG